MRGFVGAMRASLFRKPSYSAAFVALSLLLPAFALAQTPNAPAAPPQQAAPAPAMTPGVAPAANAPTQATPTFTSPTAPSPTATAPAEPAPTPASDKNDIRFKLPHNLSPWGMFMSADVVVKIVMIGLALASLLTWTIWLAKSVELVMARRRLRAGIAVLSQARGWAEAAERLAGQRDGVGPYVRAAADELRLSAGALSSAGVKERITSRLDRIEAAGARGMIRGTGILATVGATAPFVGLFGTVWGIMNSFIGISRQHTTNLAVVAPGIAEALLATAIGLVAAIPAVVMYNMFSRWNAGHRALQADASAAVMRLVSRDLDRGAFSQRPPAAPRAVTAAE